MKVYIAGLTVLLPALSWAVAPVLQEKTAEEYDLKAAHIYNLAKFIGWPQEVRPAEGRPFRIGIYGKDPSRGSIRSALAGKAADGAPIEVESFTEAAQAAGYLIVFIPAQEKDAEVGLFKALQGRPVLTLGEREGFVQAGGAINFYTENKKIRIECDSEALSKAGFTISSKLLRLMRIVKK